MRFLLSTEQVNAMIEAVDTVLKASGLQVIAPVVQSVNLLNAPIIDQPTYRIYKLEQEQLNLFNGLLDAAIKVVGLSGAANILALADCFQKPLPEETESQ